MADNEKKAPSAGGVMMVEMEETPQHQQPQPENIQRQPTNDGYYSDYNEVIISATSRAKALSAEPRD